MSRLSERMFSHIQRTERLEQGCPRPKFTTPPVQVQVPAVVVVPVQVAETKPAVL